MKKENRILLLVSGLLVGRALARWGNTDLQVIVLSLSSVVVLAVAAYIYKKTHNLLFPLGCILLLSGVPFLELVQDSVKSSNLMLLGVFSGVSSLGCLAFACMITGVHQMTPQNISRKQWKYWIMTLVGLWLVCCGGLAVLIFL